MDEERERIRKLREAMAKQKIFQKTLGPNNDEIDPDPEKAMAAERAIEYSPEQECSFCKAKIVFRTSDTIYSPKRGTNKSILTDHSWPAYLPIEVEGTERGRFGEYQNPFGVYKPHQCKLEGLSNSELLRYIEFHKKQSDDFNKWVFQELRLLKKQVVFKDVWIDRD